MTSNPQPLAAPAPAAPPGPGGVRRIRGTERLLSLSVLSVAAVFGFVRLGMWLVEGRYEGALPLALALGALLLALLGAGLLTHVPAFELALATVAWSLCTSVVCELSPFASARHIGSGPSHVPVYLVLALLTGLYALGLPRRWVGRDPGTRAAALLAFWTTANARMFERDGETAIPLLAGAVLLVLGTRARYRTRDLLTGAGWVLPLTLLAMIAWWTLATVFGDSWRLGTTSVLHLIVGICLAWALTTSLDARGVRSAFAGLVLGLAAAHVLLIASVVEMLPYNEPIRIFGSRLSLFGRHPNQVAPMFTIGACLVAPLAFGSRAGDAAREPGRRLPRAVALLLFVLSLIALAWTQSRGAILATAVGLATAVVASRGWLPRRPGRAGAIALVGLVIATAAFLSPAGAGLRAKLEATTQTQSAVGQRYHLWRSASAAIADHPWLGLGPSQYYAHARYAQPSYYDGTFQDLHPHSLFFAAAESAGLPGLFLVLILLVGVVELGRRRVLSAPAGTQRRMMVALLAALMAAIAANSVDLSQGGASLVPFLVWIALGLFAAAGRPAETPPTRAPAAGALATWLAVAPLCVMPLAGTLAVDWALTQNPWTAGRIYEVVRWIHPWNSRAVTEEVGVRIANGQRREALELARIEASGSPARLGAQLRYGLMLLEIGRRDEALELLQRAGELDPYGTRAGMAAMALARVYAAAGNEQAFRTTFLRGLTLPAGELLLVPHEPMPARPGDPEGSQRVGFRMGDGGPLVPASELLEQLGERALSMIATDEVDGRRLLGRVVAGYEAMGLTNESLAIVDRYSEHAPEMFSMVALRIDLLCKLGDYRGAAEVFHAYPGRAHPYMTVFYLRGIGQSDDPELQREFRELPIDFKVSRDTDLFFTAEQSAPVFEAQAERALVLGHIDEALRSLERALYHYPTNQARLLAAERFFDRAAALEISDQELLRVFAVLVREADLHRAVTRDNQRMNTWVGTLRAAWDAPIAALDMPFELELVLRRAGPAGRSLGAAWNRSDPSLPASDG